MSHHGRLIDHFLCDHADRPRKRGEGAERARRVERVLPSGAIDLIPVGEERSSGGCRGRARQSSPKGGRFTNPPEAATDAVRTGSGRESRRGSRKSTRRSRSRERSHRRDDPHNSPRHHHKSTRSKSSRRSSSSYGSRHVGRHAEGDVNGDPRSRRTPRAPGGGGWDAHPLAVVVGQGAVPRAQGLGNPISVSGPPYNQSSSRLPPPLFPGMMMMAESLTGVPPAHLLTGSRVPCMPPPPSGGMVVPPFVPLPLIPQPAHPARTKAPAFPWGSGLPQGGVSRGDDESSEMDIESPRVEVAGIEPTKVEGSSTATKGANLLNCLGEVSN